MSGGLPAPRERLATLPKGLPDLTLGYGAAAWMIDNLIQPNGPFAGAPFTPTPGQVEFLAWFYEVDQAGAFTHKHGVRRLAKGSGKSPFAAAIALFELLGPARFDRFDSAALGGVEGKPMALPLVQVVAVSEKQTANTMRMVRAFAHKGGKLCRAYGLDPGKTYVDTPDGGRLEQRASSSQSLEGSETSFYVADETEHWVPGNGGPELMAVMLRNAAKSASRVLETSNAWMPGDASVAESAFEDWCIQEEGRGRDDLKHLYDARIAPHDTILTDEAQEGRTTLDEALRFVYADCPWVVNTDALKAIKGQIWTPSFPESASWRFYLNRPTAAENSWVTLEEWALLRDPKRRVVDGEDIVMFFDGSKSNDHTALVGCCLQDGHVFRIGHWAPEGPTRSVDVAAVDAGVRRAFEKWHVVAFWADVREWESFVRTTWPEDLGEDLICPAVRGGMSASKIAWDMRSHAYQFAEACETAWTEIQQKQFTHDGSADLGEHVANCRVNEYKGRFSVKKESPKSPKKIDLAVCMVGARMLYRYVKASKEWAEANAPKPTWKVWL